MMGWDRFFGMTVKDLDRRHSLCKQKIRNNRFQVVLVDLEDLIWSGVESAV